MTNPSSLCEGQARCVGDDSLINSIKNFPPSHEPIVQSPTQRWQCNLFKSFRELPLDNH